MVTPFGAEVYCLKEMDSDTLIAIDKNYAFERVIASDITTDFDNLSTVRLKEQQYLQLLVSQTFFLMPLLCLLRQNKVIYYD